MISEAAVLDALRQVQDPDLHRDIVTLGFVKDLTIDGGNVSFTVELTTPACPVKEDLERQAHSVVLALDGVENVKVTMTAQVRSRPGQGEALAPGVKHIIAVASGKGGVGKSTVTVNLAVALALSGARVGLMDADVYGPCIPLMMGKQEARPATQAEKIIPIRAHGVDMMSLGFLLEPGQAVLWRGPMVAGTIRQLLADVAWGELDYLLVDLPPGTGDAPMSLAQLAPLTGVVIVSTPHQVAANIAGKAVQLFRRLNAPIMGVVENMGEYTDPETGAKRKMFHGTPGTELAQTLQTNFLGSVPFDPRIGESGDLGVPAVLEHPDSDQARIFHEIAGEVARQASIVSMTRQDLTKLSDASERPKFTPVANWS
jgi:ATP-binding protein involved in chromosome partitioning